MNANDIETTATESETQEAPREMSPMEYRAAEEAEERAFRKKLAEERARVRAARGGLSFAKAFHRCRQEGERWSEEGTITPEPEKSPEQKRQLKRALWRRFRLGVEYFLDADGPPEPEETAGLWREARRTFRRLLERGDGYGLADRHEYEIHHVATYAERVARRIFRTQVWKKNGELRGYSPSEWRKICRTEAQERRRRNAEHEEAMYQLRKSRQEILLKY